MQGFRISTDFAEMNLAAIHAFISTSYWAENIPVETLTRALENSLCFGVFTDDDSQIGFARLITDSATFAYLADVYILQDYRGQGLSKYLMTTIMAHPLVEGLRRVMLSTVDAHGLYEQVGFTPLAHPQRFMEVSQGNVYGKP